MISQIRIPSSYFRGAGVLGKIGEFVNARAKKALLVGGKKAVATVQEQLLASLKQSDVEVVGIEWYGGECTWANIEKLSQTATAKGAELIIAIGGGKALDTGKAASYKNNIPCITVPTIAATCAALTPLSIIHDEHGKYVENSEKSASPAGVFVDTEVIIKAPQKWLFAGMGDTLAKWYELRASTSKIPSSSWTMGGINNGRICYEVIEKFGPGAKNAIEKQVIDDSFEFTIDAIIFYAGMSSILGGDKCRAAAAHPIYFGFTNIPAAHDLGHGLLVGFGNLCLLALEGRSEAEINEAIKLAKDCGVPIKLSEIADLSEADLQIVGEVAANANDMKNMPVEVTQHMVVCSIKLIDRLACANF